MDLQTSKVELVKLILNIENHKLIDKFWDLLRSEQEDFWTQLSEEEKEEIHLGIKQLDEGKGIPLEEFRKKAGR